MLSDSNRIHEVDKKFTADVSDGQFVNRLFVRLVAKGRRFTKVDFKYSIFDTCYLRNCTFDSCDFTGCRFLGTNMHGTAFVGCKFDYASFERTLIDNDVLDTGCPSPENLKLRFARSLRMNYQQLGDAKSVNKAMSVELRATEVHLHKAWRSNESYYRSKYRKWSRAKAFVDWVEFKVLDFTWGNGESVPKLLRTVFFIFVLMSVVDAVAFGDSQRLGSYVDAFARAPQIFLGTLPSEDYPDSYLTGLAFVRLVMFGFLMSIIIKRFNKR